MKIYEQWFQPKDIREWVMFKKCGSRPQTKQGGQWVRKKQMPRNTRTNKFTETGIPSCGAKAKTQGLGEYRFTQRHWQNVEEKDKESYIKTQGFRHEKGSSGDAQAWGLFHIRHMEGSIRRPWACDTVCNKGTQGHTDTEYRTTCAGSQSVQYMQRVRVTQK